MLAHAGDEVAVADAEAEQEAAGERLGEGLLAGGHGHGVAGVDVGDAGGELELARGRQQDRRRDERVAADGLGHPQGTEAELLDDLRGALGLGGGEGVDAAVPDADAAEVDGGLAHVGVVPSMGPAGSRTRRAVTRLYGLADTAAEAGHPCGRGVDSICGARPPAWARSRSSDAARSGG